MLKIEGLKKTFENFKIDNISFEANPGEIVVVIGENGSGKTSLINMIMGMFKAEDGVIRVNGITEDEDPIGYKNSIGFVYDEFNFYQNLKLKDYKKIVSMFYRNFDDDKYEFYFRNARLDPEEKIKHLSKGQCEMLMIATALSHHANLIILDEPVAGLDENVKHAFLQSLKSYVKKENAAAVIFTHNINDLEDIYDKAVYMDKGRMVIDMTRKEIIREFRIIRTSEDIIESIKANVIGVEKYKNYCEALVKISGNSDVRDLLHNADVYKIKNPDINDIIYYYRLGGRRND